MLTIGRGPVSALLLRLPAVVALLVAGLLAAHGATWSVTVGLVVTLVVGFVLARLHTGPGVNRYVAVFGTLAVFVGTAMGASGAWTAAFGDTAPATVSRVEVVDGGKGARRVDEYTLRLADGTTVAGRWGTFRPGSYHVGDRVEVRYDPTGVVRRPGLARDDTSRRDALIGGLVVLVGIALLVVSRLRSRPTRAG